MSFLEAAPWLLVPAIFLARVFDVTLGTFRTIIAFRGYRWVALVVGFVESVVWVLAISQVITNLSHWALVLAYAGGFALGNWVGISLERHIAIGSELVRAISESPPGVLAARLRREGFTVINMAADAGREAHAEVVLVVERRKEIPRLIQVIREVDPRAVLTVSDVRSVEDAALNQPRRLIGLPGGWRKTARRK
ncbi:MAG: DUF5698 domain-containing protein [Xanthomonadales bacterium]|nr:DUF5698 domain-containing protein [Xanthomonadales bacterium]